MTNSEKLLSSFSENYFYKELVYADLKFTPIGGTEIELADLIINLEDIILAIQLKERNEKDRTQDKNIEEKWLKKKCKKAKEQIKDTISYITSEKVYFINARGKKTIINPSAEVVPLVVFENDSISEYEHLLRSHTNDGLAVNCMSIDDFKLMCKQLLSPIEIIEYLKWREAFYKKNGLINLLITETNNGFVLSKPQKNENLVQQYLYEKYGENAIYEDRLYSELFRQYVSVLYEHKQMESEINGCCTIYRHSLFEFGFADRADIVSDYDNRGLVHKQDSNIIVVIFFIILIVEGIHFIDFLLGELYGKVCVFLSTVGVRAEWINTEASFGLFLRSVKYLA